MFENIENLKLDSAIRKVSKKYASVSRRAKHSFNIRVSGSMFYDFGDKRLTVEEGEMIFIPRGSTYLYRVVSEGDSVCTVINFDGDFGFTEPICFSLRDFYATEYLNLHFADMWRFGGPADRYKCNAMFYELLSYLSVAESSSYSDRRKFDTVQPAVDHLKRHVYDCSLTADELHKMCGVSNTYFRRIFIARFGMSPKQYIVSKRLSYAKHLIDSGDADTVKELANTVGYTDSLYFSKAFKKAYGTSPLNAMKNQ